MKIKGVFFDFFGTLVVPKDLNLKWSEWYYSVYPLYRRSGLTVPHDIFTKICETFWDNIYDDRDRAFTLFEKRLISQLEFYGIEVSAQQARGLAFEISDAWFEEHYLDCEALRLLSYIKKKRKTALVTNFDHPPFIRIMLERYDIRGLFDSVVISGDVGIRKPDPDIFNSALSETGLSCGEVIYVGDSIVDFRAAILAGIIPVIIRRDGQHDPSSPGGVEKIYEKTDALLNEFFINGQIDLVSKLSDVKRALTNYV